jgi:deoxyribonuclease IV
VKIGFHLPIAKGFAWTHREAKRLGCEVLQIFVKNPRSWNEKRWSDSDRHEFEQLLRDIPVVAHLSYLPNPAKIDEDPKNLAAMLHEADLCSQLGIGTLVIHCGSRKDKKRGIEMVAQAVDRVLDTHDITILLENAAGQGDALGTNLGEIGQIYRRVRERKRVLLCIDTAHIFEAGYNIRSKAAWSRMMQEAAGQIGAGKIGFFHLNDSKTPLGSNVDRHWHIGQGAIGLSCFRYLLNEKKFAHLRGVMETPKAGNMDDVNMRVMRSLLSPLVARSPS